MIVGKIAFAERLKRLIGLGSKLSDDFFDELADSLVEGDFGAAEAFHLVELLRRRCAKEGVSQGARATELLAELLLECLGVASTPQSEGEGLHIALILGVNGVGKTTSAAKLARIAQARGRRPILAAADTFRAAAIDQLKIHGDRLGVRVVAHRHGGDPAAVVYDAVEAAAAGGGDYIIADTAGRMHTKTALVEELKKIDRVVAQRASAAAYRKLLVLDATTGRNALAQAETFHDAVELDAAILTKYDSSARGGIAFSLASTLRLPVAYLCTGESYGDIVPFDPHRYVREFIGLA